ncbi:MAG: hypothetical protein ACXAB7_13260 [Candidatus Kariarchaeaceae archaeon]|jgi:hypothetical protein
MPTVKMSKKGLTFFENIQDQIKQVSFWIFFGLGLAIVLVFMFVLDQNIVLSVFVATVVLTIIYMVNSDLKARRLDKAQEGQQDVIIREKKKKQLEMEKEVGKCISCTAPLEPGAKKCSACGYEIHQYSV